MFGGALGGEGTVHGLQGIQERRRASREQALIS